MQETNDSNTDHSKQSKSGFSKFIELIFFSLVLIIFKLGPVFIFLVVLAFISENRSANNLCEKYVPTDTTIVEKSYLRLSNTDYEKLLVIQSQDLNTTQTLVCRFAKNNIDRKHLFITTYTGNKMEQFMGYTHSYFDVFERLQ